MLDVGFTRLPYLVNWILLFRLAQHQRIFPLLYLPSYNFLPLATKTFHQI